MHTSRHDIFQNMALALSHQQSGNAMLAVAYWERVLQLLPESMPIHRFIFEAFRRIADDETLSESIRTNIHAKITTLGALYSQFLTDDDIDEAAQPLYQAMCQQCGGNTTLALIYWKNVVTALSSDALSVTLGVQDLCWQAHQFLNAGNTGNAIELYRQIIQTFPDFIEGYINLTLILYRYGRLENIFPILAQIPESYREVYLIIRYTDFYQRSAEILQQFDQIPYAAIEKIINDIRIENTFYPSIYHSYFSDIIKELINREKRFHEKRRKALEEKALAQTNKQLAAQGIALGERVTMAKHAGSDEVQDYLYDNHIRIAEVLLDNPNITADDVLVIAQTTHVSEILGLISLHRKWRTLHHIRMAVVSNPQTMPKDSIRVLQTLSMNDLAKIVYTRSIPTEVRIRAKERIQKIFHELALYEKIALIEASSGEILKLIEEARFTVSSFLVSILGRFPQKIDIVVNICRWKLTPPEILTFISKNSQFVSNIRVTFALLANPKTPSSIVESLLIGMSDTDLRDLLSNTHLPTAVKQSISSMFPHLAR